MSLDNISYYIIFSNNCGVGNALQEVWSLIFNQKFFVLVHEQWKNTSRLVSNTSFVMTKK